MGAAKLGKQLPVTPVLLQCCNKEENLLVWSFQSLSLSVAKGRHSSPSREIPPLLTSCCHYLRHILNHNRFVSYRLLRTVARLWVKSKPTWKLTHKVYGASGINSSKCSGTRLPFVFQYFRNTSDLFLFWMHIALFLLFLFYTFCQQLFWFCMSKESAWVLLCTLKYPGFFSNSPPLVCLLLSVNAFKINYLKPEILCSLTVGSQPRFKILRGEMTWQGLWRKLKRADINRDSILYLLKFPCSH